MGSYLKIQDLVDAFVFEAVKKASKRKRKSGHGSHVIFLSSARNFFATLE
jgi:hypothetical protein